LLKEDDHVIDIERNSRSAKVEQLLELVPQMEFVNIPVASQTSNHVSAEYFITP